MDWHSAIKGFKLYLQLEKSLSVNSIDAYLHDIHSIEKYLQLEFPTTGPKEVEYKHLQAFIMALSQIGIAATSQARMISGLRAFYHYLLMEDEIDQDPTQFIELPKLKRSLPDVLEVSEINAMLNQM
jgi:integrase/recombinase XerD